MPGTYTIDNYSCILCGKCAEVCTLSAIHTATVCGNVSSSRCYQYHIDVGQCQNCGFCEEVCPTIPKAIYNLQGS